MQANGHRAVFVALAASLFAGSAAADVKIAFIDPLSGGAAATGILAQKTHQFYIDAINAAGGINGEKIELMSFDNKVNPQESLIQLKKALKASGVQEQMMTSEQFARFVDGEIAKWGKLVKETGVTVE